MRNRIASLTDETRQALLQRLRAGTDHPVPSGRWIVRHPTTEPRLRLFCIPYAGGGASVFSSWSRSLDPSIEVVALQLPGRETRLAEPAETRVDRLAAAIGEALAPELDRPFAFFGHSMGALVAFETARHLRRTGRPRPATLLLSAFRAPQLSSPDIRIHKLCDDALKAVLRTEGIPETLLADETLMTAMLPTLRADFELCDGYRHTIERPFDVPFAVFGGLEDERVTPAHLEGWAEHTTAGAELRLLPGGHFFINTARRDLLGAVDAVLQPHLTRTKETLHA